MKAASAGKAKLEGGERLVAGIFELVDSFDANDWLGRWNKVHGNLLLDNSVARAKCRRTTISNIGKARQQQRCVKSAVWLQNATIVARESCSRKKSCGGGVKRERTRRIHDREYSGQREEREGDALP